MIALFYIIISAVNYRLCKLYPTINYNIFQFKNIYKIKKHYEADKTT